MSISRWDPWTDMMSLREAMDELLRESFVRPRPTTGSSGIGMPLDIKEEDNEYVVRAVLPGVKPEDVNIQIKGDTLHITGELKDHDGQQQSQAQGHDQTQGPRQQQPQGQGQSQGQWLVRERRFGRFQRTITLPTTVKADQAEADFENGVLTVHLPKSEESRSRSIPIRGSQGSQEIEAHSETQGQGHDQQQGQGSSS